MSLYLFSPNNFICFRREAPTAATKRNIAAMARDNQIPVTKRFEEEVIFEDDGEILLQKRDYGEELGADASYDDPRDKNDRKICEILWQFSYMYVDGFPWI